MILSVVFGALPETLGEGVCPSKLPAPTYTGYTTTMKWWECYDQCAADGLIMLCIQDEHQNDAVKNLLVGETNAWLGLTDAKKAGTTEGEWVWNDGCASSHTNWGESRPDGKDYAMMSATTTSTTEERTTSSGTTTYTYTVKRGEWKDSGGDGSKVCLCQTSTATDCNATAGLEGLASHFFGPAPVSVLECAEQEDLTTL